VFRAASVTRRVAYTAIRKYTETLRILFVRAKTITSFSMTRATAPSHTTYGIRLTPLILLTPLTKPDWRVRACHLNTQISMFGILFLESAMHVRPVVRATRAGVTRVVMTVSAT
jgi:hypothetical protein